MAGILRRLRQAGEAFVARSLGGEALSLQAEIPGRRGPLWQMRVELQSEPHAGGERVRLRVRTRLDLRREALPPPPASAAGVPAKVGRWMERRLQSRLVRALASPVLDRTVSTWIEVQASSAPLDEGARALLPDRLRDLGISPDPKKPVQTWTGALPGPKPGLAALTLARLDQDDLPEPLRRALGDEPFHFTAAIASVVEEH
ncbi:MAG TPA: hypothetical protein VM369_06550 [Candidatus Binatia bacterium]|nr:hypothetical protein [Candidatus Binatia bacterium]